MDAFHLHHLLSYNSETSQCAPIYWDLHDIPSSARYVMHTHPLPTTEDDEPTRSAHYVMPMYPPLSVEDLDMTATVPSVSTLHVTCDVLPFNWPIIARNIAGVTVRDVLFAIYECLQRQMSIHEWNSLSPKQRNRINLVFDARWRLSSSPSMARSFGLLRVDCLLRHALFGGLTPIPADEPTCVLTLRVQKR
ncbi:hypothetical protein AX17_004651 [Amanita inopinata Kibby_2008]|nr:hypothetical protein AX17_004651 [Amanita inopinata Kibby_2008]